jgi:hypothetical protein
MAKPAEPLDHLGQDFKVRPSVLLIEETVCRALPRLVM